VLYKRKNTLGSSLLLSNSSKPDKKLKMRFLMALFLFLVVATLAIALPLDGTG
jgi:hypothetical protein